MFEKVGNTLQVMIIVMIIYPCAKLFIFRDVSAVSPQIEIENRSK